MASTEVSCYQADLMAEKALSEIKVHRLKGKARAIEYCIKERNFTRRWFIPLRFFLPAITSEAMAIEFIDANGFMDDYKYHYLKKEKLANKIIELCKISADRHVMLTDKDLEVLQENYD